MQNGNEFSILYVHDGSNNMRPVLYFDNLIVAVLSFDNLIVAVLFFDNLMVIVDDI